LAISFKEHATVTGACASRRLLFIFFRFWYEIDTVFTKAQLAEIRKQSFSRIMCDSGDAFGAAPLDAFRVASFQDMVSCAQIPGMNLLAWREGPAK
jgi:hypothetical protein